VYHKARWYAAPHWWQLNRGISLVQPPSDCFWSGLGNGLVVILATSIWPCWPRSLTLARGILLVFCSNHREVLHVLVLTRARYQETYCNSTKLYVFLRPQYLALCYHSCYKTTTIPSLHPFCHSLWSRNMVANSTTIEKHRCIWSVVSVSHIANFLEGLHLKWRGPQTYRPATTHTHHPYHRSRWPPPHRTCWSIHGPPPSWWSSLPIKDGNRRSCMACKNCNLVTKSISYRDNEFFQRGCF